MSKRIQIPVSKADESLLKSAAKRSGLSLAEWARRLLFKHAKQKNFKEPRTHALILKQLKTLDAPIDSLDTMIRQSFQDRYR